MKTAVYDTGAIEFKSCSTSAFNKSRRHYCKGEVDLFAVYAPHNNKIYLVPMEEVTKTVTRLRLDAAKSNQQSKVKRASCYEVREMWGKLARL